MVAGGGGDNGSLGAPQPFPQPLPLVAIYFPKQMFKI
jgi:hypothetical protein